MKANEIDVPHLISETDKLYERIVQKAPDKTKLALTAQRIVENRKWEESLPLYEDRLEKTIEELRYFYVPKVMRPGPAFIFPMKSADGQFTRAQTKPLPGSVLNYSDSKYRYIGDKENFIGPNWLGNDRETIRKILHTKN